MMLRVLTQRNASKMFAMNRVFAMAPTRAYYKDNVLMPREQGEYYSDPMEVAERVVRLVALHDNCSEPSQVNLAASFT